MRLHCTTCEAYSICDVLKMVDEYDANSGERYEVLFCQCPTCKGALLALREIYPEADDYGEPSRVWPAPKKLLSWHVPDAIQDSLEEAQRCLEHGCYTAAAIMCRRTLEVFCRHHGATKGSLEDKVKVLFETKVIDERLNSWAKALRDDGNLAAHDPEATFTKDNATDLVDFTLAFMEYAFVLTEKFEEFNKRRAKLKDGADAKRKKAASNIEPKAD